MRTPLHVLILSNTLSNKRLVTQELRREGFDPSCQTIATETAFVAELKPGVELIVAICSGPELDPLRALKLVQESGLDIPVIVVCGSADADQETQVLQAGAADCVPIDHPARLGWAARRTHEVAALRWARNKAEQALERSEAIHKAMLTNSQSLIFLKDPQGRYVLVNPRFERTLKLKCPEVIGKCNEDIFDLEQAQRLTANDQKALAAGEALEIEEMFETSAGIRAFMARRFPVRDGQGQVTGLAAICIDVTDCKQAEFALRQSEEQYRNVVENAMEGLAIHQDGVIRFANQAAARLAGYERPEELIGRNVWRTFVAPEARAALQARCAACLRGETLPMHAGWPGIRKDGSRLWVQSSVTPITWQGQPALLSYFSDITERRRTEESLRASEERFSKAFHGSPLPVSIVTVEHGRYIDANTSLLRMVGRTREEVIGRTALQLNLWVNPSDRCELVKVVGENSIAKNYETRLRMKSGEIRDVLISAEQIQLGQERCMIVVTQDITERKRAEENLRQLEEQFRQAQKMEAVGQLAGGIAHDFNNLLTIIQGHAALLTAGQHATGRGRDSAEQITLAAERAGALVRQLLTFSRRQAMQPKNLDIREVIEGTGNMLRRTLGEDIELAFELAPALPLVHADPGMLEQVLLNLAVNSRDAMPNGGKLTIGAHAEVIDPLDARSTAEARPGPVLCITVTDTGCGIAPENMNRLFEPFFTTKAVGKGTGLGLATAYGIVKQHQGWFRVSSILNRGSTFRIFLPAVPHETLAHKAPVLAPPVQGGREGILVVEDEGTLRMLVRNVLEQYGYQVFEADSGTSAIEVWSQRKEEIDLLLTDMVMPNGLTGRELARRLQAERPGLKVIYSSGYSPDVIEMDSTLENGMNFLQKPYEPRHLAAIVRARLDEA